MFLHSMAEAARIYLLTGAISLSVAGLIKMIFWGVRR